MSSDSSFSPLGLGVNPRKPWLKLQPRLDRLPWPLYFIWLVLACQIAILFLGNTPLRLPLRIANYGGSLLLLFLLMPRYQTHPSLKLLKWAPLILAVGLIHPEHNSYASGCGQICLYIAIYGPLTWVAGCRPSQRVFERVLFALWIFNAASAATGVLQVYFPGRFQGATSEIIAAKGTFQHGAANVVLADGSTVQRPFGLTDTPGGAATGGLYAIVLGIGIFLTEKKLLLRTLAASGMLMGLFAIFLSQVRVDLVMAFVCTVVLISVLGRRGDWGNLAGLGTVLGVVILLGGAWAFAIGGKQTIARFSSLTESSPTDVYSANRGFFVTDLINNEIPRRPFGAGLGRWGMMNAYFGNNTPQLWSEIMWTGWLYDGGVPLILLYSSAFFTALWFAWHLAVVRTDRLGLWSGVVFSYNMAALAGTFVFPLFVVQSGLEFWLINACLFFGIAGSNADRAPFTHDLAAHRTPPTTPPLNRRKVFHRYRSQLRSPKTSVPPLVAPYRKSPFSITPRT